MTLIPRIQPYDCEYQSYEQGELVRAGVPLFNGALVRNYRPWDAILPDGKRVYKPLIPPKKKYMRRPDDFRELTSEYVIPPQPLPQQRFCDEGCRTGESLRSLRHPEEAFLSEEGLPAPEEATTHDTDPEIISDQN